MNQSPALHSKFNQKGEKIIDSYSFYCYIATIIEIPEEKRVQYQVQFDPLTITHLKNFYKYENEVQLLLEKYVLQQKDFCTFNQLYKYLSNDLNQQLDIPFKILIPVLLRVLNFEKLGYLLIDEQIDEIYLDSSEKTIYLDHSRYGRCTTTICLSKSEIESFIQRVALENDFSLNRTNPTMKSDFVSPLFHTRVTVDIPPLIIDDIHIDIRKFRSTKLKISDLIKIGSITMTQAIFIILLIKNRTSISIIGPPNSGKTTLQNALIEYIPSYLRLLSVEDVLESTETRQGNRVRFRLGYDPQDALMFSKSLEIQKILHRSPDFINLGELSTKGHFTAYLNVLSVGVPSIQTIHGKNPEFLFSRLRDIYNIPLELLKSSFPHIFIELDVIWIGNKKKRFILRIAELTDTGEIVTLLDNEIESFLSQPNRESKIFTLKSLIGRNQIKLNELTRHLNEIALDLCNNQIGTIEEVMPN
jgi:type IV secretory pathway ATPase VirB11/archaellum biosynthesis ATPase